jgi:hypothetical protein
LGVLADDKELPSKIVTSDETWVYHWNPPTKQESMQWVHWSTKHLHYQKSKNAEQCSRSREVIDVCGFVEMEHPPSSPDLAPSDYYLFPKLKKHLRGRRFSSVEHLKEVVEEFFVDLSKYFFLRHSSLIGNTLE